MPVITPTGGGSAVATLTGQRVVTSAEILAFPTPVTVVPAPGAGVLMMPLNVAAWVTPGTIAYANGEALALIVGDPAHLWAVNVLTATQVQGITSFASAVPILDALGGAVTGNLNFTTADWTNAALTVNLDPNGPQTPYIAGNGTLTFWVEYALLVL